MITGHSTGGARGTPQLLLAYSSPSLNTLSSLSFLGLFRAQHIFFCSEPLKYYDHSYNAANLLLKQCFL